MKSRRVKFIWGASEVVQGRWYLGLFGFYTREQGVPHGAVAVSVRGVLAWGAGAAALVYLAAATALFFVWARNPYSVLGYADAVFYPVRRAEIATKQGQAFIAEGLDALREKKWQHALVRLQGGLARCPGDLRARGALAQIFSASQQRPQAARVLLEGLTGEYPGRGYLTQLFAVLEQMEDHDTVADTAARYLTQGQLADRPAERRWLTDRRYAAFVAAERHAEALAVAEADGEGEAGFERRVLSLLALGRSADAARLIEAWAGRPGANRRTVVRLQVRASRERGRIEEMQAALAELRALSPGDPAPLVYTVVQLAMAGRTQAAASALDDYLFRFGGSAENILLAANPLAETGQLELVERCHAAARERGYPPGRFRVLLIELRVRRGEWAEAGALLGEADATAAKTDAGAGAWAEWMRRLIDAAARPADGPTRALLEWIRSGAWPAHVYRLSGEAMLRSGQNDTAHEIAAAAARHFPKSIWVGKLTQEAELLRRARAAALPEEDPARKTQPLAERAFSLRLAELLAARAWDDAARHVQQATNLRPAPPWLERQDPAIRLAQMEIAQARRDLPALSAAARLFLNGDEARAARLHDRAAELFAQGDAAAAVALVREIARRSPAYAPAQRSLQEWAPGAARPAGPAKGAAPNGMALADDARLPERIRARREAGDIPGLISTTRLYLNGDRDRSEQATALAREFLDAGDKEAAARVIREILRETPGFQPALRLQAELK